MGVGKITLKFDATKKLNITKHEHSLVQPTRKKLFPNKMKYK
jgi:hypothetical protein